MSDQEVLEDFNYCTFPKGCKSIAERFELKGKNKNRCNKKRNYECEACFRKFSSKQNRKRHIMLKHLYSLDKFPVSEAQVLTTQTDLTIPKLTYLVNQSQDHTFRPFAKIERIYLHGDKWASIASPELSESRKNLNKLPHPTEVINKLKHIH